MSLRKKQQGTPSGDGNPTTQIGIGGIMADGEEEDKYKAYADHRTQRFHAYFCNHTYCCLGVCVDKLDGFGEGAW